MSKEGNILPNSEAVLTSGDFPVIITVFAGPGGNSHDIRFLAGKIASKGMELQEKAPVVASIDPSFFNLDNVSKQIAITTEHLIEKNPGLTGKDILHLDLTLASGTSDVISVFSDVKKIGKNFKKFLIDRGFKVEIEEYPDEYEQLVLPIYREIGSPTSLEIKIPQRLYGRDGKVGEHGEVDETDYLADKISDFIYIEWPKLRTRLAIPEEVWLF